MSLACDPSVLPSRAFQPRVYGVGAWTDHLHFAYDLVATLRPRLLVELGTDRGESYFAFCQATAQCQTGTRCCAVDTWRGDHQSGGYDETTFAEVAQHNAAHYAEFSTLRRSSFDEARGQFEAGTIDLLHLDGLHTEAAVRHDLKSWLPKVCAGGLVLLHDIGVRRDDFGVWKLWDELRQTGRSYTFPAGPGLGVWQKPPALPLAAPAEPLLSGPNEAADALAGYYSDRARELQEQIGQQWRDGSIRQTAVAGQTIVQVFHTHDGSHREEQSVAARIGHEAWKEIALELPAGAGAAPLRIDFVSAYTTIDLASITVAAGARTLFSADRTSGFAQVEIGGDARQLPHPNYLRLQITGIDPQLYLPPLPALASPGALRVALRLRVSRDEPRD
ncbi:MAG: class I SAM-dependent methyltransferase [Chthoniobacterales bacterium]